MWRVASALVVAAACGVPSRTASDAGAENDAPRTIIDATPADSAPTRFAIELDYDGDSPLTLAYRNVDGPWTPVDPGSGTGAQTIIVTNKFEVAYACGTAARHVTSVVRLVPHQSPHATIGCFALVDATTATTTTATPATATVSGALRQAGTISIGSATQTSATGPWAFSLKVIADLHDVYAWDGTRIAWQLGVDLHASTTLPAIDLADGAPFTTLPLALTGAQPDEQLTNATAFEGRWDIAFVEGTGANVRLLPAALAAATDYYAATLRAESPLTTRTIDFSLTPAPPTALAFLPRLAELAFSPVGATWTTPLAGDLTYQATSDAASLGVYESRVWRSTTPAVAVDLSAMPGYDLAWLPPGDAQHDVSITSVDAYGTVFATAARDYALAARRRILP